VKVIRWAFHKDTNKWKGSGTVTMNSVEDAKKALSLSPENRLLCGRQLEIHPFLTKEEFKLNNNMEEDNNNGKKEKLLKCFNCNLEGHLSKDCPTKRPSIGGDGLCFVCNKPGHFISECPEKDNCKKCGEKGHWSNNCPQATKKRSKKS
jgi:hypothetical protein